MRGSGEAARRRASRARAPSSVGYLLAAFVAAMALFFGLWWMLVTGGDEAPWIPAGLAASVVLLVALSAREVVMRRAWTRYLLDQGGDSSMRASGEHKRPAAKSRSSSLLSTAWRTIQKQSEEAESGNNPEAHFDVFHLCQEYLAATEEALRSNAQSSDKRNSIRSGQERVRALQKHHLLTWARDSSRSLTYEAQQRARTSERIEAANRALHCLESALKFYPQETELQESRVAIQEFIASVKVAHWVELAERSAFKGHYRRAIDRYKDALFYLSRGTMKDDLKVASTERIGREIDLLQARLRSQRNGRSEAMNDDENNREEGTSR
jgi:tetratricopeptide (TPR) repeat protein